MAKKFNSKPPRNKNGNSGGWKKPSRGRGDRPERKNPRHSPLEHLPSTDEIMDLLRDNGAAMSRSEIAKAFKIEGDAEHNLRRLLYSLLDEGILEENDNLYSPSTSLPESMTVQVSGLSEDGEMVASIISWRGEDSPSKVLVTMNEGAPAPAIGAILMVQPTHREGDWITARLIRPLSPEKAESVLGVLRIINGRTMVESASKKGDALYYVPKSAVNGAVEGELVRAETIYSARRRGVGTEEVRIVERIGSMDAPKAVSLIAIHSHEIPMTFPANVLEEAASYGDPVADGTRVDLRALPLVTIDGEDARDFDDAVYAEPLDNGGFHLVVAIADVAHYVRPASALDDEALKRGNSVYFPDRVVPMLPEALSNGLCSLNPQQDRYCLAMHMWIDSKGEMEEFSLDRAIMRSKARLTYNRAQAAFDGKPDAEAEALLDDVIKPLYAAYHLLAKQRKKRGALEIDLPEYYVKINDAGEVAEISTRERFDSHKLVEEFMILANVAAARMLSKRNMPSLYRVHESPDEEKINDLTDFLYSIGVSAGRDSLLEAGKFNQLFAKVAGEPIAAVVHTACLRAQMQAYYAPDRLGHFGLALKDYAHFTSPIRRYSDLIVHRGLIAAYELGDGGISEDEKKRVAEIGEHISATERRAMQAERESKERYAVSYLSRKLGETMTGIVSGTVRTGMFISLTGTGTEGYIPLHSMRDDYYIFDEKRRLFEGRHNGRIIRLGDAVSVRLDEANPLTGQLRLSFIQKDSAMDNMEEKPKKNREKNFRHRQQGDEDTVFIPAKKFAGRPNKKPWNSEPKRDSEERGERKTPRRFDNEERGERRPPRRFDNEERGERRPPRRFDNEERGERRPPRRFDNEERGERRPPRRFDNEERGERRPPRRFNNEGSGERRPPRRFDNEGSGERRPPRRFDNEGSGERRPPRRFDNEERGERRPPRRFGNEERGERRPPRRFDNEGSGERRPPRRFDNEERGERRPPRRFDNEERGERRPPRRFDNEGSGGGRPPRKSFGGGNGRPPRSGSGGGKRFGGKGKRG